MGQPRNMHNPSCLQCAGDSVFAASGRCLDRSLYYTFRSFSQHVISGIIPFSSNSMSFRKGECCLSRFEDGGDCQVLWWISNLLKAIINAKKNSC